LPEIFVPFMSLARRVSRGTGLVAAESLADRFGLLQGTPVSAAEALAYLRPFAVHLGRHEGVEWFVFANSDNTFLKRAKSLIGLHGQCTFRELLEYHQRSNRSLYASEGEIPESVLRAVLEVGGMVVTDGGIVHMQETARGQDESTTSEMRFAKQVFDELLVETGNQLSVRRVDLIYRLQSSGMRESAARLIVENRAVFRTKNGHCRFVERS